MAGLTFAPANAVWMPDGFSDWEGFYFSFDDSTLAIGGSVATQRFRDSENNPDEALCADIQACLAARGDAVSATFQLPLCSSETIVDCISGLSTISAATGETLENLRQLSASTVSGDPARGYFGGSGPTLVTGSENYLVSAKMSYSITRSEVSAGKLEVTIIPVTKTTGSQYKGFKWSTSKKDGAVTSTRSGSGQCLWEEVGVCWVRADHDFETEYRLDLKVSDRWGGFIRGRLMDPEMGIEAFSGGSNLTVQGKAQMTQKIFIKTDPKSWSTVQMSAFCMFTSNCDSRLEHIYQGLIRGVTSDVIWGFFILDAFREDAADTARALEGEWSFQINNAYNAGACTSESNGFLGMVTTNAPVIQDGFPTLDSGYLNYKVAGLHYAPDGETVNEGTYDFVLRSDVARCIYGFTNAPVSATVAVVGEQGEEKVATTLVSETDGWLKLSAYGFTFSEKEIQVRLSQSQIKTLASFSSRGTTLSNSQKSQIRSVLAKSDGNTKFVCTGIRYFDQPMSDNIKVIKRAKAACDYAKTIRPEHSYWYQTKVTQAKSYNGKVMVVSK
jgi:hypothetical protein